MIFKLRVSVKAVHEYSAVAIWYKKRRTDLGLRFLGELQYCFGSILEKPTVYQLRKEGFRHAFLDNFPYRVVFKVKGNEVFIYQVRHTSRKPSARFGP